ncbi:peptide chain release factor N(5)-glutamine methyltransferase [Polynucleobacter cosmopolitanus]|uniref:Release factor glutamine methyltransferase n=1 Tax=Polynucleobacter cosmopolitanus TaxID=351345 RepID=A0A229FWM3_9BURK|nr:peptide chain release factor N(5)-glutamine methyltransferase [Polynucleobacter cosmopolitanus]OXL16040.1 protein-(glutamine-N5) methyltransferase, release factor-specific [Polynucleobacter cosmopolitanus]
MAINIREILFQSTLDKVDAKALLAHLINKHLNWPKSAMISRDTEALPKALLEEWALLEKQRAEGQPVAYLIGKKGFFNIELKVAPGVLIPRPETELLVELTIDHIQSSGKKTPRILDLGTGSGAIGLALAKNLPNAQVTCVDVSAEALQIAQENARLLNLNSVKFLQSNWFDGLTTNLPAEDCVFDVIVSNPPYIPAGDHHLLMGDLRFEPSLALTDDHDGLMAYRAIFKESPPYLAADGFILVEHGFDQSKQVCQLLQEQNYINIKAHQDLAGIWRVASANRAASVKLG